MKKKISRWKNKIIFMVCGLLLVSGLIAILTNRDTYAESTNEGKLLNGSFEEGQTWTSKYEQPDQANVPAWNTTATDGKIELFQENTVYINGVTLKPSAGNIAAELNAEQESTLYQNVSTVPSSIYEWGLDHGARNGTDTMALVIGPKQEVAPSKTSKNGRDQLMQMVDWLIEQGETSVKTEAGLGEHLVVYSKKFGDTGTFKDNAENSAFSLTPSSIYTEEWHIWIMADSKATSGTNPWGKYGINAEGSAGSTTESGNTEVDTDKYYLYTVPSGQTETLFGFVSVGCVGSTVSADKQKTYGNFLDNINFHIYHPLSGSTTIHGSGVIGGSDGTVEGTGSLATGHEVTVGNSLITYAADGEPLKIQAVIKAADAEAGCEFVGLYYTKQDSNGDVVTEFLEKNGNVIDDENLTDEEKAGKWIKSINDNGDVIYTYHLEKLTTATDLHFIFIKSPTITYDSNGGEAYIIDRETYPYNTLEADNVYSFKPVQNSGLTFIPKYVSYAAVGKNDGWKFMGWLLTGDRVTAPEEITLVNAEQLGTMFLPGEHTIVCDYSVDNEDQYFKIYAGNVSMTDTCNGDESVVWNTDEDPVYANVHKGLTLVAQWRWLQAFIPQVNSTEGYVDSTNGGTIEITGVTETDPNYNAAYNAVGGKSYHAKTDEIITVTATPKTGYQFEGWYDEDGNLLTTKATYSYTETKESVNKCYARFSQKVTQNYIRQVKNGSSWDNTTDDGVGTLDNYSYTVDYNTSVSSTVVSVGTGYEFLGWYDAAGNMVEGDATFTNTVTANATYCARFAKIKVTHTYIRQLKNGDGWDNISNNNIATLSRYSHTVDYGNAASSTATAGTGYKFLGWYDTSGNKVTGNETISKTATGSAQYYARFEIITVTQNYVPQIKDGDTWVTVTSDAIGSLDRTSYNGDYGTTASSTATAGTGYKFLGWYDGSDNKLTEDATYSNTVTEDTTYYARFEIITVTHTYIRQLKNGDTWVTTENNDIAELSRYENAVDYGTTASSTATAGTGYKFLGWYDGSDNKLTEDVTYSNTVTEDATYYARFEIIKVTQNYIRQIKNGDTWVTTENNDIAELSRYENAVDYETTASSTATAGTGYKFLGWYDGSGNKLTEETTYSNTATEDATYYARFEIIKVTQEYIRQIKNGDTWVPVTSDAIGTLDRYSYNGDYGTAASSTATAGTGYKFLGWYDGSDNKLTEDATYSNTVTEDATYYARFEIVTVTQNYIRQMKNGDEWVTITDDEIGTLDNYSYAGDYGKTASSTATAGAGYKFLGWYDVLGNKLTDNTAFSNTLMVNATYYARFEEVVIPTYSETITEKGSTLQLPDIVIPEDVAEEELVWYSDNPNVAIVDEEGNVRPLANGICTITVMSADGSFSAICTIIVNMIDDSPDAGDESYPAVLMMVTILLAIVTGSFIILKRRPGKIGR